MAGSSQQGAPQNVSSNTAGNTAGTTGSNSSTNTGPWSVQQPFLQTGFGQALNLADNSSPLAANPTLQRSWTDMTNMSQNTPAMVGQGNQYLGSVLSGQFLNPSSNQYLAASENAAAQPLINQYLTATSPGTASAAEMANRYGSGAANQMVNQDKLALGTSLGNLSNNFYSGAYNTGINQMEGAAGMIPQQLAANYAPSQFENQAGQQQQAFLQAQQQYPWLTAQLYSQLVGGNYGQSGTSSNMGTYQGTQQGTQFGQQIPSAFSNPAGSIFGGALAGLGTAGQLGFSPFSSAVGGAAGAAGGAGAAGTVATDAASWAPLLVA